MGGPSWCVFSLYLEQVVNGQKKCGLHRHIGRIAFRKIDGQRRDRKICFPKANVHQGAFDQKKTFKIAEGVGPGIGAFRVRIIPGRQPGVRVSDPHYKMFTFGLAGQQIGQMIVVQDLKPAVDDSGVPGKDVLGKVHSKTLGIVVCTAVSY